MDDVRQFTKRYTTDYNGDSPDRVQQPRNFSGNASDNIRIDTISPVGQPTFPPLLAVVNIMFVTGSALVARELL
jgi:hypothetical protein